MPVLPISFLYDARRAPVDPGSSLAEPRQSPGRSRQSPGRTPVDWKRSTMIIYNFYLIWYVLFQNSNSWWFFENPYARLNRRQTSEIIGICRDSFEMNWALPGLYRDQPWLHHHLLGLCRHPPELRCFPGLTSVVPGRAKDEAGKAILPGSSRTTSAILIWGRMPDVSGSSRTLPPELRVTSIWHQKLSSKRLTQYMF
jgi:hypothetical protein